MTENNEVSNQSVENQPIYYKPSYLNIIATLSGIFSWVVLAGFLGLIVGQYLILSNLTQGTPFTQLIADPQALNWMYTNMVTPLFFGIVSFFALQGVSVGLNVLLEIDFNIREND